MKRQLSLAVTMAVAGTVAGIFGIHSGAARADVAAGKLVVLQVHGTISTATASAISLLDFDVNTVVNPGIKTPENTWSVSSSGATALTLPGLTGKHDGMLRLSSDGQYLTFGGYRADLGAANPTLAFASSVNRAIGQFEIATATFNTATALTDAFNNAEITTVLTDNGTHYWVAGGIGYTTNVLVNQKVPNIDTSGGLRYVGAVGGATASVNLSQTQVTNAVLQPDSYRAAEIVDGQLYVNTASQGSFGNRGTYKTPTPLPTSGAQALVGVMNNLEGNSVDAGQELAPDMKGTYAPKSDLVFTHLTSPTHNETPGMNTAYGTGGKGEYEKWSLLDDGFGNLHWQQVGIWMWAAGGDLNALALSVQGDGTTVDLYATTDGGIYHFTDTTGYSDAALGIFSITPTLALAADAGTQFRGVVFLPVPEPASLGLMGLAGVMLLVRRRK